MKTQMVLISRYAGLILVVVLLILSIPPPAQADPPNAFADFMKCDNLLGKSPQAVLTALGPPTSTSPMTQYDDGRHILYWMYQGQKGYTLELVFFNKALLVVDVNLARSQDQDANLKMANDDLRAAFKTCKPSSLKMTFLENDAEGSAERSPTQLGGIPNISVTGTTQNEHLLTAKCQPQGDAPLLYKQVMNQNTSVYEDKYVPNPSFMIKSVYSSRIILSEGKGDLYEHYSWTKAEVYREAKQEKASPARRGLMNLLTSSVFAENFGPTTPVVVVGLTPENSPWFFDPSR